MGSQKTKKGPSRKLPKRRSEEARALQEPQYRGRVSADEIDKVIRRFPKTMRRLAHEFDDDYDSD